jgi:DNA-binding response OmpR family regulator
MDVLRELTQAVQRTSQARTYIKIDRTLASGLIDALNRTDVSSSELSKAERWLTYTEFRIFRALFQAGHMLTYNELMSAAEVDTIDALWVHIRRLRVKLEVHKMGYIDTIRGRGYIYRGQ